MAGCLGNKTPEAGAKISVARIFVACDISSEKELVKQIAEGQVLGNELLFT